MCYINILKEKIWRSHRWSVKFDSNSSRERSLARNSIRTSDARRSGTCRGIWLNQLASEVFWKILHQDLESWNLSHVNDSLSQVSVNGSNATGFLSLGRTWISEINGRSEITTRGNRQERRNSVSWPTKERPCWNRIVIDRGYGLKQDREATRCHLA